MVRHYLNCTLLARRKQFHSSKAVQRQRISQHRPAVLRVHSGQHSLECVQTVSRNIPTIFFSSIEHIFLRCCSIHPRRLRLSAGNYFAIFPAM